MQKKRSTRKRAATLDTQAPPANAKICEQCGFINSFKRVKCEKCSALLPEGNFERSRRMREQLLKREQQLALSSTLFTDKPIVAEDYDDGGENDPIKGRSQRKGKGAASARTRVDGNNADAANGNSAKRSPNGEDDSPDD